jgi:hypothetical protein
MSDGIVSFPDPKSSTSLKAGALCRVWLRMRIRIARGRRRQAPDGLNDWILRDIGLIRERDMGASFEANAREAARRLWYP